MMKNSTIVTTVDKSFIGRIGEDMKIHYQNKNGEEKFIDNVVHLQNLDNETFEALLSNQKVIYLKVSRIEGIYNELTQTIEAQQREIDRIKQLEEALTECLALRNIPHEIERVVHEALTAENIEADKDEQTEQMKYLLRRTLPILEVANDQQGLIDAINALLGGKEDAGKK